MTLTICDMKTRLGYIAPLFAALILQAMIGAASAQEAITLERIGAVRMAPSGAIERDTYLLAEAFRIQTGREPDDQTTLRLKASANADTSDQPAH